jgi:hypothetical protein
MTFVAPLPEDMREFAIRFSIRHPELVEGSDTLPE